MIFVAIASYRDPELPQTIASALATAVRPHEVRFGICDQNEARLPWVPPGEYVHVLPRDSKGLGWARATCFALYRGEDYLLQVDSHTLFDERWDDFLINALAMLGHKPIISSYPMPYTIDNGVRFKQVDPGIQFGQPKPGEVPRRDDPQVTVHAVRREGPEPQRGCHLAGGFIFTHGHFVEEVPYDPYLYFRDELAMSVRAFTHGWNVWHIRDVPLYHLYRIHDNTGRPLHHDHEQGHDVGGAEKRARERLCRLLYDQSLTGYGLGSARSLEQFEALSGIGFAAARVGGAP